MRHVTDDERRARLATRHALTANARVKTPEAATRAMTVLHATEPASVHLSCWARVRGYEIADLRRAFQTDRTLMKQLAMRRTLFVFPRDLLPAAWASASARVAVTERTRMVKDVVAAGITDDGDAWIERARREVLEALSSAPEGLAAADVRRAVPWVDVTVHVSEGVTWSAPRILTQLGASADIVRGIDPLGFPASRPRWTLARHWLDEVPEPWSVADGYRELIGRWLATFGPGTEDDIVWWLGSTKTAVRAALAELDAVQVSLDSGSTGWLLPDDLGEAPDPGSWVALLPVLDPTVMGWKERDFYLGPHRVPLFDDRGNAGTTAWVDGRVVGCWVQGSDGVVELRLLESVSPAQREALDQEAARLTAWLGGTVVGTVYRSRAMR
jgi:hypothetical protein